MGPNGVSDTKTDRPTDSRSKNQLYIYSYIYIYIYIYRERERERESERRAGQSGRVVWDINCRRPL
jgi:hypothetical protein